MKSIIKLFHGVLIEPATKTRNSALIEQTLPYGFIYSPEVIGTYSDQELLNFISMIESEIGLTKEKLNATFHKSWKKVRDQDITQLILEQVLHYLTTYGFESLGIYDKDRVFIPVEKLKIPDLDMKHIPLVVIHGITEAEVRKRILDLITSGIALKADTIAAIMDTIDLVHIENLNIDTVKNKDVRCLLFDKFHQVPQNPLEFLRYVVYKATDKTLLIKDKATIDALSSPSSKSEQIKLIFELYERTYGLNQLASIFYRFKPLFLAIKKGCKLNHSINQLRKKAVKYHLPMSEDYLNSFTAHIKHNHANGEQLQLELDKVNTFRKVRLAYALQYRMTYCDSIVYKIRNGKSWATAFDTHAFNILTLKKYLKIVIQSIENDIRKNVHGKKVFIDKKIIFALPATEKQFSGNFPSGSYLTLPTNMVIGVNWSNINGQRIDLDLSLLSESKYGWDSLYRSADKDGAVLFSGDVTDAPTSATEAFFLKKQPEETFLLLLNYYNIDPECPDPVPFKLFAAREKGIDFNHNYMVNPNNLEMLLTNAIDVKEMMLGLISVTKTQTILYLGQTGIGNSISSGDAPYMQQARKYMIASLTNPISLNDLLVNAGAQLVSKKEDAEIDLSLDAIQKDSIIKLLT